jgi:hypothetical protein
MLAIKDLMFSRSRNNDVPQEAESRREKNSGSQFGIQQGSILGITFHFGGGLPRGLGSI